MTTITHIEVLTVLQEHFKNILEEFLGEQQKEITRCLNRFAYFKDWNHRTVVECCILARIVRFEDNIIIMGGHTGDTENSYFLVTGSCQVIYHLQLQHIPRYLIEPSVKQTRGYVENNSWWPKSHCGCDRCK